MSNVDGGNNVENDGSTNIQIEITEETNNQTTTESTPTRTALSELPPLNDNERSFVCCCLTSQSAFRLLLLTYWIWTLASFSFNADTVFPALLYLFPFCSLIFAFIGSKIDDNRYIMPFFLMIFWDALYGLTIHLFTISFSNWRDQTSSINQFLYDYWPEKAKEFEAISHENLELCVIRSSLKLFYICVALLITTQEDYRLHKHKYIEKKRRAILRQRELELTRVRLQNLLNEQQLNEPPQDPYAQLFSQVPPPPSYEAFSHPVLRTPQLGTPPPTYSMLERDGRLQSIQIPWSSTASQIDGQQRMDFTEISINLKRSDTPSTAMSPSSFLQSPLQPSSSTVSSPKKLEKENDG